MNAKFHRDNVDESAIEEVERGWYVFHPKKNVTCFERCRVAFVHGVLRFLPEDGEEWLHAMHLHDSDRMFQTYGRYQKKATS